LFAGGENEFWLGETGVLPAGVYVIAGVAFYASMRRSGLSWRTLAQRGSQRSTVASAV